MSPVDNNICLKPANVSSYKSSQNVSEGQSNDSLMLKMFGFAIFKKNTKLKKSFAQWLFMMKSGGFRQELF